MRLSNFFFSKKTTSLKYTSQNAHRRHIARFETLESRELLALSTATADYRALLANSSLDQDGSIWVTSLDDVVNTNDGKITLREALDYATQTLSTGETVSSSIKFKVGGTITLSSASQSLKILSKSVSVDASDVGGVSIQGTSSLLLYVFGGTAASTVSVSLNSLTFSNANGSGIQLNSNCNLIATQCAVINNRSASELGVAINVGAGTLTLVDSYISGNVSRNAMSKGGAVYVDSGSLTAINTVFKDNQSGVGGALYLKGGSASLTGCTFLNNKAQSGDGGAIYSTAASLTITNGGFKNNLSAESGGAIYVDGEESIIFTDVQFSNNSGANGGAVYQNTESLSLTNARFIENNATQNGGALYICQNSSLQISQSSFTLNVASNDGGAIYNAGSLFINTANIEQNQAGRNGGAILSSHYFEIRDTFFDDNAATHYGGTIYNINSSLSWLLRSRIQKSTSYEGAAIYSNGKLSITDVSIVGNTAQSNGGGIVNLGECHLSQAYLSSNSALGLNGAGGGVLNYPNAGMSIANTIISSNTVPNGSGGGIANNGSIQLDSVTIDANTSGEFGGGVYNGGALFVQYSSISSCKAENGGAIATTYGSTASCTSSTLWGNEATIRGGALYCYGSAEFISSTLAYNIASTAAVAAYYSPEDATSLPSFDSSTTISNNKGKSSTKTLNEDVVFLNAQDYSKIDNAIYFGDVDVLSKSFTQTAIVKNTGVQTLSFNDLSVTTNADSSIFEYIAVKENGAEIDLSAPFTLKPNESFYLTIAVSPENLGGKVIQLDWSTVSISEEGVAITNSEKSVSIKGIVNIAKSVPASAVVFQQPESDFDISFNENGNFTLALSKAPTENVIVYLNVSDNAILSTDVLLFTPSNYNVPQTISVAINSDYFRKYGTVDEMVEIKPQIISSIAEWNGVTFSCIELEIKDYIGLIGDQSVDLNRYASPGTTRWDLNNDGFSDLISYNEPTWINSDQVKSDVIVSTQTRNGITTTKEFDSPALQAFPQAQGELFTFEGIPGMVRLEIESTSDVITTWRIDWGDGSAITESNQAGMSQILSHCYAQDGNYVVSIEIVNTNNIGKGIWSTIGTVYISNIELTSTAILETLNEEKFQDSFFTDPELSDDKHSTVLMSNPPKNENIVTESSIHFIETSSENFFERKRSKRLSELF